MQRIIRLPQPRMTNGTHVERCADRICCADGQVPHVSGVAALVAATRQASLAAGARPSLQRALWVKNVLLRSAAYVPALAPFVRTAGMVDAYRAVYLAQHGDLPTDGPLIRPGKC